jgi:molecular chaperone GrpE
MVMADADNMRKRLIQERENERIYAIQKFARELLEVNDNLARAVESIPEEYKNLGEVEGVEKVLKDLVTGVSMTRDIFCGTLGKFDVSEYNP